jgi:hypothetical protein
VVKRWLPSTRLCVPAHAILGLDAGTAAQYRDLVGHHERGIETHAKLADQARVGLLFAGKRFQETARAGTRDRTEIGHDFLAAHADAVVAHRECFRVLVEFDVDVQPTIVAKQFRFADGLEAQFVAGVGGVGNQFAQEDFLVRIQRVRDQAQDLCDLGFEGPGFGIRTHGNVLP